MTIAADPRSGEALYRRRERRTLTIKLTLFAVGLVEGGFAGFYLADGYFTANAAWPAPLAVALSLGYLVAILGGAWLLRHSVDELERNQQYKSVTFAGAVYVLVYPIWFLLWKGQLAPEPSHWQLFLLFWVSLMGASFYHRFR